MKKYLKYLPIVLILALAFFLRVYKAKELFNYDHDNDLAFWIVKDVLVNHHLRLIGQQTSVTGVFIGALFYYLQIPFYLIGKMDSYPTVFLTVILGTFSVFSFYFVFSKIFGKKVGLIGALIYAVSQLIVFSDREVVPTMPVMVWTVWYLYDLFLIYKGKQKTGFILFGILIALIWHINLALYVISPLAVLAWILSKKKIQWRYFFLGIGLLIVLSAPLIIFEARHNFQQTKAVIASVTTNRNLIPQTSTGWAKLDRVMQLVEENTRNIFLPSISQVPDKLAFIMLVGSFLFLIAAKKISKEMALTFFLWQIFYVSFFTANSLNLSEYYLDGMNVIWIAVASLTLGCFFEKRILKAVGVLVLASYSIWNIYLVLNSKGSQMGYVERKAIVKYINEDAEAHGYPCISISYITNPGYNLGYRYFFYLDNMHVNDPKSGSPVYTIVFPLSLVDKFDKRFGVLGLILPDYIKYNKKDVDKSCQGENANLTDPMFGYTE
ncbi:MAG: glycosyltransferase family 39 protein [Candidatus Microgenomates bacterium]